MKSEKTSHILNASSNLIGFAFVVLTSIKTLGLPDATLIDDIAALEILLFSLSSVSSFIAMRTISQKKAGWYEITADYLFFMGLIVLSVTAVLISFSIIK